MELRKLCIETELVKLGKILETDLLIPKMDPLMDSNYISFYLSISIVSIDDNVKGIGKLYSTFISDNYDYYTKLESSAFVTLFILYLNSYKSILNSD